PRGIICACLLGELRVQRVDALVELSPLGANLLDEVPHAPAEREVRIGEHAVDGQLELATALRDRVAALEQDRSELVQQGSSCADEPLTNAVQRLHVELV